MVGIAQRSELAFRIPKHTKLVTLVDCNVPLRWVRGQLFEFKNDSGVWGEARVIDVQTRRSKCVKLFEYVAALDASMHRALTATHSHDFALHILVAFAFWITLTLTHNTIS